MESLKIKDLVKHKDLSEKLRIKRIYSSIATCERLGEGKIYSSKKGKMIYPVYICHIDNLEKYNIIENDNTASIQSPIKQLEIPGFGI